MLKIENLAKSYGADKKAGRSRRSRKSEAPSPRAFAVADVTFEVRAGELFTLLGPSGCGKTTTLRSVAGLERPDSGNISLEGTVLFDGASRINLPTNKRGLGMVFQSYAIWPHMSVFDNVAFPLKVMPRRQRPAKAEISERVLRVLEVINLGSYADRAATMLSGGQQQRLALARAMVTAPPLMLLDEPLSNLDAKLRESMRFEIKRLQRELGLTSVYVTHDQTEALMLSSRIAVMNEGRIEQIGKPRDIYLRPASEFVAKFIGTSNMLGAVAGETVDGLVKLETSEGVLWSEGAPQVSAGSEVLVSIRPERLEMSTEQAAHDGVNTWRGSVVTRAFLGDSAEHVVVVGKHEFRVRSDAARLIAPGTEVFLSVQPQHVTLIPAG